MNAFLLQLAIYLVVLLVLARPLGAYMAGVFGDKPSRAHWLGPVERLFYRAAGVNPQAEMSWKRYAVAVIVINLLGALAVYALQRLQQWLPLNPQGFGAVSPDSSFNTAISFVANTNWQGYSGESTMSTLTQMLGLAVQNFLSAATGIAVVIALIRGFARHSADTIGNFWVDFTRATVYVLLPLSIVVSVFFVSQGVIQNFDAYKDVATVTATTYDNPKLDASGNPLKDAQGNPVTERATTQTQTLPMGPVASQEAIKMLGTNGGGFFNANSAHPYENPNALTNFVQMLAIFIIPAALCFTFGGMVGDRRQGWAVLAAMTVLFVVLAVFLAWAELHANPMLANLGVDQAVGNMEGKETRFGIVASALFATITTAASCGAVNAMHDSFTALGGFVPMFLMQLGEVVFGGVGSGLYGMLVYAILAVFIAGLMIGRTPEYLGKKIEVFEMKMTSIVILVTPLLVLVGTAVAVVMAQGKAGILNPGPHGFSEVLYAFSSAANNNGSAFAGLSANTPFYNVALGIAMWLGRFWIIVPVLAMAGTFAAKKRLPVTVGTLPTHGPLFVVLLIGAVLLVGALTYIPALALGPIAEHLAR
ncbi:potassium-transporting ATPase subunit KdpA [Ralstonia sp. SET104]|uniref:potassium-transporting ATPase subunit KdpA n=1 Tax=Ralstonia sp. SET104 TaxID=2448774 RepID=UPI000F563F62|nr:potassium-transporting ATPase subunit KdpA [Ralstonia sp. SET104]GCB04779.1 potassium-transporting ATPase potassium-binding subunit [Ralstonia sp. SET104]